MFPPRSILLLLLLLLLSRSLVLPRLLSFTPLLVFPVLAAHISLRQCVNGVQVAGASTDGSSLRFVRLIKVRDEKARYGFLLQILLPTTTTTTTLLVLVLVLLHPLLPLLLLPLLPSHTLHLLFLLLLFLLPPISSLVITTC
eukprot:764301-Hanusia_phi.AAC.2